MKIFWSWQSDTPGKIGRFVVRDALRQAIEELQTSSEIEEPTSKETRESLHLDHDIQGVAGSPDLVSTIFAKIDQSAVLVADVTLVGRAPDRIDGAGKTVPGKKLINSNVAIELGYGLRSLTDKRVLLVFNEHYGKHEELPFDLRHKGGAVVFDLSDGASRQKIEAEKQKLKGEFIRRLKTYIEAEVVSTMLPVVEIAATFSKAAYFEKGEALAQVGDPDVDQVHFAYDTESLCYLRLIPTKHLSRPLTLPQLRSAVGFAPLLHRTNNSLVDVNSFGAISFDPANNPPRGIGKLNGSTQIFENGEVWSVSAKLIVRQVPSYAQQGLKVPFVPSLAFESAYYEKLRVLMRFAASNLGVAAPWTVEVGATGLGKAYIAVHSEQWGPFRKTEVVRRATLDNGDQGQLDVFLLDYFSGVFEATGYERPEGLNHFPPEAPR
jgi:hypothetical protein